MHSLTDLLSQFLSSRTGELSFGQTLGAIAITYIGGVLTSLTPCVYPMIPITVGVMGGLSKKSSSTSSGKVWHKVWIRSLSYVSGMAVIYSFLGVLAGLTGKVFGSFTNTPTLYLILGIVMNFAALMMLDIIPFDPLVWIDQIKRSLKLSSPSSAPLKHSSEISILGAFSLGASSGLIAAPCTTPVLTTVLAFISKTQSVSLGLVLMLAFSAGLGTLLILIAIFAGAIQILPRSGHWMKTVKTLSGLILLCFAEYLIYRAGALGGI